MTSAVMEVKAVVTTLLLANYLINQVGCIGTFQVLVYSFTSSATCSSSDPNSLLFFRVCLSHFQARVATDKCTYGEGFSTPIQPSDGGRGGGGGSLPAAVNIGINFAWPGSYSLIIEAKCNSTDSTATASTAEKTLLRMVSSGSLSPLDPWWNQSYQSESGVRLDYGLHFVCDENLYGPSCSTFCHPRDDPLGHYTCGANGTLRCMDGWTRPNNYCDTAVCQTDCNQRNGTCVAPDKCSCNPGWSGVFCDVCLPAPDCSDVHGSCLLPGECNCEPGWGGIYCKQDLQFCTNNNPCLNGGTCRNSGPAGFECDCQPGYAGPACQYACPPSLCHNGASCIRSAEGKYSCNCQPGYTGDNCQTVIGSCQSNPCLNGGRCLNSSQGIVQCQCPAGYRGHLCEQTTDDGCPTSPCLNGGTCYDPVTPGTQGSPDGGRRCLCDPGFTGLLCDYAIVGSNQSANATASTVIVTSSLKQFVVVVCLGVLIPVVVIATTIVVWFVVCKWNRRRRRRLESSSSTNSTSVGGGGGGNVDNIRNDLKSLNNYSHRISYEVPAAFASPPHLKITNIAEVGGCGGTSGEKKVIAHAKDVGPDMTSSSSSSSLDRKKYSDASFKQLNWTGKYEESEKNVLSKRDSAANADDAAAADAGNDDANIIYSIDKSLDRFASLQNSTCLVEDSSPSPHRFRHCYGNSYLESSCVIDCIPEQPSSSLSIYATPCATPCEGSPVIKHQAPGQPLNQYSTLV